MTAPTYTRWMSTKVRWEYLPVHYEENHVFWPVQWSNDLNDAVVPFPAYKLCEELSQVLPDELSFMARSYENDVRIAPTAAPFAMPFAYHGRPQHPTELIHRVNPTPHSSTVTPYGTLHELPFGRRTWIASGKSPADLWIPASFISPSNRAAYNVARFGKYGGESMIVRQSTTSSIEHFGLGAYPNLDDAHIAVRADETAITVSNMRVMFPDRPRADFEIEGKDELVLAIDLLLADTVEEALQTHKVKTVADLTPIHASILATRPDLSADDLHELFFAFDTHSIVTNAITVQPQCPQRLKTLAYTAQNAN